MLLPPFGEPDPRNVRFFEVGGRIFSRLTDRHAISLDVEYFNENESKFGSTKGLQFGLNFDYNYRQLSLDTGLEFNLLERENSKNESLYWYLRLRRLF